MASTTPKISTSHEPYAFGRVLVALGGATLVVAGLKAASSFFVPVMLAAFLAVILAPAKIALTARGVPGWLALIVVGAGSVVVLGGLLALLASSMQAMGEALPAYERRLDEATAGLTQALEAHGIDSVVRAPEFLDGAALLRFATDVASGVLAGLSNFVVVLLIMLFALAEVRASPSEQRQGLLADVQAYLAVKALIGLISGICVGLWGAVLGLDFPIVWAFLLFVFYFVPTVGTIIATVPPVLLAWLQGGVGMAALVGGGYLAVGQLFGNVLEPKMLGDRLGISPLVVFLSLLFWGWVWGPVGMLLSVPLTMIVKRALQASDDAARLARWMESAPPQRAVP